MRNISDLRSVGHHLSDMLENQQVLENKYESKGLQGLQRWSEGHDAGPSMKPTQGHRRMSYIQFSYTILRGSRELCI